MKHFRMSLTIVRTIRSIAHSDRFQVAAENVKEAANNYINFLIQSTYFLVQSNISNEEIKGSLNKIPDQGPSRATAWHGTHINAPTDDTSQGLGGTTRPIDPLFYLFNLFSSRKYSCSASIS
jgi:hypothetical protein